MLTTGNQLKAARALLDLDQTAVASLANVNVNTIRNLEGSKGEPIKGHNQTVITVQKALEAAGIEFLNHGEPGVRLKPRKKIKPSDGTMKGYTTDPDEADRIE
jgi:transcriptional regulator with XRE-family HTH domain